MSNRNGLGMDHHDRRLNSRPGLWRSVLFGAGVVLAGSFFAVDGDAAPVVDGFVMDPVTGVVEAGYLVEGINYTLDSATGQFAGLLYTASDAKTLYFGFAQSVNLNDNTYGPSAIGWKSHKLGDLLGSDNIRVEMYDSQQKLALAFYLDYGSDVNGSVVSLGAQGGDGKWVFGNSAALLASASSLEWNFNHANPLWEDRWNSSPPRSPTNDYSPGTKADSKHPWIYETVYEWSVDKAAMPNKFEKLRILEVHNSPLKSGVNPEPIAVLNGLKKSLPESGTPVTNGQVISYFLTFTNVGLIPLTNVIITDVVDPNLTEVVLYNNGKCSAVPPVPCGAGSELSWDVGTMAPGQSVTVRFDAIVEFQGNVELVYNWGILTASELPTSFQTNTTVHPCGATAGQCRRPICGNGNVEMGEECDDGNHTDGDGCDSMCRREVCGDGILQLGEQCDDGNTTSGDGCDDRCLLEPCPPTPVPHAKPCIAMNSATSSSSCTFKPAGEEGKHTMGWLLGGLMAAFVGLNYRRRRSSRNQ